MAEEKKVNAAPAKTTAVAVKKDDTKPTFFSSLFISRNHFWTRLKKPGLESSFFTAVTALAGAVLTFFSSAIFFSSSCRYFVSTCLVCFLQNGQYLLRSKRSDVFFLFLTVL
jgi:hypothetical protein